MKSVARFTLIASLLSAATAFDAVAAPGGFNPRGRSRASRSKAVSPSAPPPRASKSQTKSPSDAALIRRYTKIVAKQPNSKYPLERLVQLVRKRDGDLTRLVSTLQERERSGGRAGHNASLTLAALLVHSGQLEEASRKYQLAVTARPSDAGGRRTWAHLLMRLGHKEQARIELTRTLEENLPRAQRDKTLQQLIQWSLDFGKLTRAKQFHSQRIALAGGSFYVRAELGRELMTRRRYSEAETAYRAILPFARGDARTLGPSLRDLGRALLSQNKHEEAIATLQRARNLGGIPTSLRQILTALLTQAHRGQDTVDVWLAQLESEPRKSTTDFSTLAELHAELGNVTRAISNYKRALKRNPRSVDARLSLLQLLQLQGDFKQVLNHRILLCKQHPNNPQFTFQLADAHLQAGERTLALRALKRLEDSRRTETSALIQVASVYEKLGESQRQLQLLQRLAKEKSPRHLEALGEFYYAEGDTKQALATWKRIVRKGSEEADSWHTLGEIYLAHDLPSSALSALRRAYELSPNSSRYARSLALGLEQTALGEQNANQRLQLQDTAQQLWKKLQHEAEVNRRPRAAREARQHRITQWSINKTLEQHTAALARKLSQAKPSPSDGRLLAEAQMRLLHYADAEKTLRRLLTLHPQVVDNRRLLVATLVKQQRFAPAIDQLDQLTKTDPARSKHYFEQMAKLAEQSFRQEDALRYAAKAVELSPNNAQGHLSLGRRFERRHMVEKAIHHYRLALHNDNRLYPAYFQLAELLVRSNQEVEADQYWRQVIRESQDDQQVSRAARSSLQFHLERGSLKTLESTLVPLALGRPEKGVYRQLLLEVYGALSRPLVRVSKGSDAAATKAQLALQDLGRRSTKPLLDTLRKSDPHQQRTALSLLWHLSNPNAAPALFSFALGDFEVSLRQDAMEIVANLRDATLLRRLEEFVLQPSAHIEDRVRSLASLAIANLHSGAARPTLHRLLNDSSPTVQTIAVFGLQAVYRPSDSKGLLRIARNSRLANAPRVAAALVLARQDQPQVLPTIRALSRSTDETVAGVALAALAHLNSPDSPREIAAALLHGHQPLASLAARAACQSSLASPFPSDPRPQRSAAPQPLALRRLLVSQLAPACSPATALPAIQSLVAPLREEVERILQKEPQRLLALAEALVDESGRLYLPPLTNATLKLAPSQQARLRLSLDAVLAPLDSPMLEMARNEAPILRQAAMRWLSARTNPKAKQAVLAGLQDEDANVQEAALNGLALQPSPQAVGPLARTLVDADAWYIRRLAARTLRAQERFFYEQEAAGQDALRALTNSALTDSYSLVRNEAATSLNALSPQRARSVLETLAASDVEPEVRENASLLLSSQP